MAINHVTVQDVTWQLIMLQCRVLRGNKSCYSEGCYVAINHVTVKDITW